MRGFLEETFECHLLIAKKIVIDIYLRTYSIVRVITPVSSRDLRTLFILNHVAKCSYSPGEIENTGNIDTST